jgi:hypothetical protein
MARRRRWSDLSERDRGLLVLGATIDAIMKIAALIDLKRRPAAGIRGRKWAWATVITLANSVGIVPVGYFLFGRRPVR